jgi:nicotinate-nucleotide--dimethylbenzimidazole phosphoribosyltransferase
MKVRYGTANMLHELAMTPAEATAAVETGIAAANAEIEAGARLLLTGDMGIGNTTSSAAIAAVLTDLSVREVTGPGTGLGLAGWRRKCDVIERAIVRHQPAPNDPLDILSKIGGLEIAAIVGVVLTAAAARVPVVIDGFVSTAGAALASVLSPAAKQFMIAGHRTTEPGHNALLTFLELNPILDLGMHLGEGTGAVLALPILEAAVATLNEMATFEEAGVSTQHNEE